MNAELAVVGASLVGAVVMFAINKPRMEAMAVIVAPAASSAFMIAVSSPFGTLRITPGSYTFGDFVRVGMVFDMIVMVARVIMVSLLLPL